VSNDLDPAHDIYKTFNIGRAQYQLKPASYLGAIVTDVEGTGAFNRVAGIDSSYKLSDTQTLTAFALQSFTQDGGIAGSRHGFGGQTRYTYETRTFTTQWHLEHYDTDFQMDTAFQNQVGDTNAYGYADYNFYPDKQQHSWLRRIQPFTFNSATRDRIQRGHALSSTDGVRIWFTKQGFFRFDVTNGYEPWMGQRFGGMRWRLQSNVQATRWLQPYFNANAGASTFYDDANCALGPSSCHPFQGEATNISTGVTLQPSGRFRETVDYTRVAFDRRSTGERVYTVNILNTRTVYQFTAHFFLRGIAQYDSSQTRVLTDFLASYEPHPGTVIFAGYGSLIEQRDFVNGEWIQGAGSYLTTQRGLFLKTSYLLRF
jgi:hypothetical protein